MIRKLHIMTLIAGVLLVSVPTYALAQDRPDHDRPHQNRNRPRFHHDGQHPQHGDRGPARLMSPKEIDQAIEIMQLIDPERAGNFAGQLENEPRQAHRMIQHWFPRIRRLIELRTNDPQMFELRVQDIQLARRSMELGRKLRATGPDQQEEAQELHQRLAAAVTEHFEVRQKIRERRVEQLEQEVSKLREQLQERRSRKEQLMKKRLGELTGERKKETW